jgi:hypothetical protein
MTTARVHVCGRGRRHAGRALLAVLLATTAGQPAAADGLKFTFDADPGTWQLWFNATRDACNSVDTPDQSMAAFRRDDGTVVAFIGDADREGTWGPIVGGFYRSYGPSVLNLTRDCSAPVLKSGAGSNGPGVFPHNVWLMATWTGDGNTVHGLVHDEFSANATDTRLCPHGASKANHTHCWYTTVLAVVSTDGGRRFDFAATVDNPRGIALAPPVGFNPELTGPQGFPNSHTVQGPGGYLYALLGCGDGAHLPSAAFPTGGKCVYRTTDIGNVGGWRGWDGEGWSATVVDPYVSPAPPTAGHYPAVVGSDIVGSGSVVYLEAQDLFVMMGTKLVPTGKGQRPVVHVYYQTSTNMTTWSGVLTAGSFALPDTFYGCATYPRLMDAASPSRNFDVIGGGASAEVYLLFSTGLSPAVEGTIRRAGVAVPVRIEQAVEGRAH